MLKSLLIGAGLAVVIPSAIAAGTLALTAPKSPPPLAAIENAADPFSAYAREQPPALTFTARDGEKLAYRFYPGRPGGGVAVAVHGSSGSSLAMHGVAKALAAKGITVYAIDLRGHGLSRGPHGRRGDVVYRGQYEDDLADVSKRITAAHPGEKRLLIGHSVGGAVILRTASLPAYASGFDSYIALSPFIAPGTAMDRPDQGGWTSVSIPRIVTLSILNRFGISAGDHLTVLAMAVPPGQKDRVHTYSHALLASANLPRNWEPSVAAITAPVQVLIGADDELFTAAAYPDELGRVNPKIGVTLLPAIGHMGIVHQPQALEAVTAGAVAMLK